METIKGLNNMKWLMPKGRSDYQDFNSSLPENDGGVCVEDSFESEADEDIKAGRIKRFNNADDLIESLKRPW